MPPCFYSYGQQEIEEFYRVFARETGDAVPILLYNVPQFTSAIELGTIRRLLDTGLFAGVNDASGDWAYFEQLLDFRRERPLRIFAGNDRMALPALRAGADGLFSAAAAAIPELVVAMGRMGPNSDALNARLQEFLDWTDRFPQPMGIKRAVELRRQKSGEFATPFDGERTQEREQFSSWFKTWWPNVANLL